jgi:hypothetical protein
MISHALDDMAVDQPPMPDAVEAGRARVTFTLVSMASLLACAFSATSAIEIGSSTHPFSYDKAARESFGRITPSRADAPPRPPTLARVECLFEACRSITGPIVRIAAPSPNDPLPAPPATPDSPSRGLAVPAQPSAQPTLEPHLSSLITAFDAMRHSAWLVAAIGATPPVPMLFSVFSAVPRAPRWITASASDALDDDDTPPPLPERGYAQPGSPAAVAPLPFVPRRGKFAHYVEVTLPSGGPWFALPSVEADPDSVSRSVHATLALGPLAQGG